MPPAGSRTPAGLAYALTSGVPLELTGGGRLRLHRALSALAVGALSRVVGAIIAVPPAAGIQLVVEELTAA